MVVPPKSRYERAVALEGLRPETVSGAVRFTAGGFALGRLTSANGNQQTCIRFSLHEGTAIEVALGHNLADKLAQSILAKGGAK